MVSVGIPIINDKRNQIIYVYLLFIMINFCASFTSVPYTERV